MNTAEKIRVSIAYAVSLASISLFVSAANVLAWLGMEIPRFLAALAIISLVPLLSDDIRKSSKLIAATAFFTIFALGVSLFLADHARIPGDPMDSFILLLVASLLLTGMKNAVKMLYSGLSFYIVGTFLLLAFSGIKIIILLADALDYYVNCIGEVCDPYGFALIPSIVLFILAIPAVYPYRHRNEFRRGVER